MRKSKKIKEGVKQLPPELRYYSITLRSTELSKLHRILSHKKVKKAITHEKLDLEFFREVLSHHIKEIMDKYGVKYEV